jgi:hypothetical protein
MSEFKIIDTVKRAFTLLKEDPTLMALFILPALFPIERIIGNYLQYLVLSAFVPTPELPSAPPVHLLVPYLISGFLLGVWASAAAILKVTGLDKGTKMGIRESLSQGLRKIPRLLVPIIVSFALYSLMISAPTIAISYYALTRMEALAQTGGLSLIVPVVAAGCLFILVFYAAVRLRLSAPACISESNFGLTASWRLVRGNWWKLCAILLIFGVMSALMNRIPIIGVYLSDLIVEPLIIAAVTLIYFQLSEAKPSGAKAIP